jgi:ribosomal protein S18 acetylase RimI-like enzyme
MTQGSQESVSVNQAGNEDDVERVNAFFNSKEIKQALHRFTYSTTLERAFERDDRRLFYVENGEEIIGALMVWCESRVLDPNEAQIRLVAVADGHRNQGVGERLCQMSETFADEYGMKRISADVASESSAVDFWKALGYEVTSEWETDNGRKMCLVEKPL